MAVLVHPLHCRLLPLPAREVARVLSAMLQQAGANHVDVEVHVLRDGAMSEQNLRHMGCSGPTNVLSFPPAGGKVSVPGLLLLSADTLRRECLLYGQEEKAHLLRLLAHGLAHVLGHDHGPDMDRLCEELWQAGAERCGMPLV